MARNGGLGALIAIIGLAFILSKPRAPGIQPVGWHTLLIRERIVNGELPHEIIIRERGLTMPPHIVYPQVNDIGRLPPQTPDYERELEKKYPVLMERTRVRYAEVRRTLGLRKYVAPPMPREAGGIAPGRVTR